MPDLFKLNVTNTEKGKFSSNLGTAHEYLATGILTRLGFDVSVSSVKGGMYDLFITAFQNGPGSKKELIRAQVKTCPPLRLYGGVRAGADRDYVSTRKGLVSKKHKYTIDDNDLLIGVHKNTCDFYLLPTRYVRCFKWTTGLRALQVTKNNWDILLNWRKEFLDEIGRRIQQEA